MRTGFTTMRALAVAAVGVVALAACGVSSNNLKLATGSTGGTYYSLGGEIAKQWSDRIDGVQVSTQTTDASIENLNLLDQQEVQLIMSINGITANAVESEGPFSGDKALKAPEDVRFLGNVYPEVVQIAASKDSGIKSIEDLKGKRVDFGPPGGGTQIQGKQILEAYGMDPEKDVEEFNSTFEDAGTKLADGQIDAAITVLAVPAGAVEQVATGTDVNLVEISGEGSAKLREDNPSYQTKKIPAGTYKGQTEDVETLTNWAGLYAGGDLEEDVAYDLVRVMYERADDLGHDVGNQVKLDTALEGQGPVDLHPGAERYYKEKKVLK